MTPVAVFLAFLLALNLLTAWLLYRQAVARAHREQEIAGLALSRQKVLEEQLDEIRSVQLGVERPGAAVRDSLPPPLPEVIAAALDEIEDPVHRSELEELARYRTEAEPHKPAAKIAEELFD